MSALPVSRSAKLVCRQQRRRGPDVCSGLNGHAPRRWATRTCTQGRRRPRDAIRGHTIARRSKLTGSQYPGTVLTVPFERRAGPRTALTFGAREECPSSPARNVPPAQLAGSHGAQVTAGPRQLGTKAARQAGRPLAPHLSHQPNDEHEPAHPGSVPPPQQAAGCSLPAALKTAPAPGTGVP